MTNSNTDTQPSDRGRDYPSLMNLVNAYFYQDYDKVSEDPDEIVMLYRDENPPNINARLIQDVRDFLVRHAHETDNEIQTSLVRIFKPEFDFYHYEGRTTRQALRKIIDIMTDPTPEAERRKIKRWPWADE